MSSNSPLADTNMTDASPTVTDASPNGATPPAAMSTPPSQPRRSPRLTKGGKAPQMRPAPRLNNTDQDEEDEVVVPAAAQADDEMPPAEQITRPQRGTRRTRHGHPKNRDGTDGATDSSQDNDRSGHTTPLGSPTKKRKANGATGASPADDQSTQEYDIDGMNTKTSSSADVDAADADADAADAGADAADANVDADADTDTDKKTKTNETTKTDPASAEPSSRQRFQDALREAYVGALRLKPRFHQLLVTIQAWKSDKDAHAAALANDTAVTIMAEFVSLIVALGVMLHDGEADDCFNIKVMEQLLGAPLPVLLQIVRPVSKDKPAIRAAKAKMAAAFGLSRVPGHSSINIGMVSDADEKHTLPITDDVPERTHWVDVVRADGTKVSLQKMPEIQDIQLATDDDIDIETVDDDKQQQAVFTPADAALEVFRFLYRTLGGVIPLVIQGPSEDVLTRLRADPEIKNASLVAVAFTGVYNLKYGGPALEKEFQSASNIMIDASRAMLWTKPENKMPESVSKTVACISDGLWDELKNKNPALAAAIEAFLPLFNQDLVAPGSLMDEAPWDALFPAWDATLSEDARFGVTSQEQFDLVKKAGKSIAEAVTLEFKTPETYLAFLKSLQKGHPAAIYDRCLAGSGIDKKEWEALPEKARAHVVSIIKPKKWSTVDKLARDLPQADHTIAAILVLAGLIKCNAGVQHNATLETIIKGHQEVKAPAEADAPDAPLQTNLRLVMGTWSKHPQFGFSIVNELTGASTDQDRRAAAFHFKFKSDTSDHDMEAQAVAAYRYVICAAMNTNPKELAPVWGNLRLFQQFAA